MKSLFIVTCFTILILYTTLVFAATDTYDSGGPLMPEQAAYDVTYYDLSLFVNPSDSSIHGALVVEARIVQPLDRFVLDLDTLLIVTSVTEKKGSGSIKLQYIRQEGKIWIELMTTRQPGDQINIQIAYGGNPRIAPNPPWSGGFTWKSTADGSPWIATSCQGEGADIWWPNKDHVSDKPDSMGIHIRIQDPLVVASNGRLISVESHEDQTSTYHWFVSTPISCYNVALNIAPYKVISENYSSVTGEEFPVSFWVLPEDYEKGVAFFPQILQHLNYFERSLGPYPFRADKYGVAQTPHLGMEHQTIIAYGAKFDNSPMTKDRDWGFDALHHHELSHEWWGNAVTCSDWRDMWIHEGFGTYMQILYLEETQGIEISQQYLESIRDFWNIYPVAPRNVTSASEIWKAPIYFKGAWILHTLRYLIGEESFNLLLRKMIYPDPALEKITDGRQVRFVTTSDFLYLAESISGQELDWFFEIYLRQPELPVLVYSRESDTLKIHWEVPGNLSFPMPIDIKIGNNTQRVEIPDSGTEIKLEDGVVPELDPHQWLLCREPYPGVVSLKSSRLDNYIGRYEFKIRDILRTIEITREGEDLYLKINRFPKLRMFPSSEVEFFFRESEDIRVRFNFNDMGEVIGLTHNFSPTKANYKKLK